jgi:hypothetical protein
MCKQAALRGLERLLYAHLWVGTAVAALQVENFALHPLHLQPRVRQLLQQALNLLLPLVPRRPRLKQQLPRPRRVVARGVELLLQRGGRGEGLLPGRALLACGM